MAMIEILSTCCKAIYYRGSVFLIFWKAGYDPEIN